MVLENEKETHDGKDPRSETISKGKSSRYEAARPPSLPLIPPHYEIFQDREKALQISYTRRDDLPIFNNYCVPSLVS
jgi:hypothetical protein